MEDPGFWDNADKANNSMKELKNLKDTVEEYHRLEYHVLPECHPATLP